MPRPRLGITLRSGVRKCPCNGEIYTFSQSTYKLGISINRVHSFLIEFTKHLKLCILFVKKKKTPSTPLLPASLLPPLLSFSPPSYPSVYWEFVRRGRNGQITQRATGCLHGLFLNYQSIILLASQGVSSETEDMGSVPEATESGLGSTEEGTFTEKGCVLHRKDETTTLLLYDLCLVRMLSARGRDNAGGRHYSVLSWMDLAGKGGTL